MSRLLGASFPRLGISPWDLILDDDTRIEVKSAQRRFTLGGSKDVDVRVFVHKKTPALRFSVATSAQIAKLGQRTIAARSIEERFGTVGAAELASTVASVRRRRGRGSRGRRR